jgi:hypothetical protein
MIGIFGEDYSDFATLKEIVRSLTENRSLTINGRGFGGKGNLLNKCADHLKTFYEDGYRHFVICHDSNGDEASLIRERVHRRIVAPSGIPADGCCIVVPVQEIEAWILADIRSARKIFPSWRPAPVRNPERMTKPSRELERMSRQKNLRPRYSHPTHNPQIVQYLNLDKVAEHCPSFRPLREFVLQHFSKK